MISNLRDLGGMPAAGNTTIRKGMLIRSADLSGAEKEDLQGISAVIDLRTTRETEERPDRVYDAQFLHLPIFEQITAGISHEEEAETRSIPGMAGLYAYLIRTCTEAIRNVLTAIIEHDYSTGAVLWHCTEGKDRSGITAALVLEMLGVSRERIMEDYMLTNVINLPKAEQRRELLAKTHGEEYAQSMYQAIIADESYLNAAWEAMGPDYIRGSLNIGDDMIEKFRRMVLE
ncbi:MAG: tyrosine-protein phosphatase [Oscillospiraceae bacterium]|nr:tyrosine-protein phosphatase [Oscillospiraceae bacterium]